MPLRFFNYDDTIISAPGAHCPVYYLTTNWLTEIAYALIMLNAAVTYNFIYWYLHIGKTVFYVYLTSVTCRHISEI